jgi:hypothetical protein
VWGVLVGWVLCFVGLAGKRGSRKQKREAHMLYVNLLNDNAFYLLAKAVSAF